MNDVSVHARIEELEPAWEHLADRLGASPFLRPGWFAAWWSAFGGRGQLRIVTVTRSSRLVGVLPLQQRWRALTSLANWHTPVFAPLLEDRAAGRALARTLVDLRPRRLELRFLPPADVALLESALTSAGFAGRTLVRVLQRSPYLVLPPSWDHHERRIDAHQRREIRRRRRRLEEAGPVSVEVSDGRHRLDQLLGEGFAVEGSGWKDRRGTAIRARQSTRSFYADVARWAAGRGWLRLAFLRVGSKAIAFDFCLEHGGAHYLLKTGYRPEFARFAPGVLLRYEMLRRACTAGMDTYEFLGSDEGWKLRWTTTCRDGLLLHAFPPSPGGVAMWFMHAGARPAAARAVRAVRARPR